MENLIFLRESNQYNPIIFAVSKDIFTEIKLSDTYDKFGQTIDRGDAGEGITLLTEKAVKIANEGYNEFHSDDSDEFLTKWELDDYISAYDYSLEGFDAVVESNDLEKDVDYDEDSQMVTGYTFWNGNNWKTITIAHEYDEPTHEVISDKKLIKDLNEAIEKKSFKGDEFGLTTYQFNNWLIVDSQYQGTWAKYEITDYHETVNNH